MEEDEDILSQPSPGSSPPSSPQSNGRITVTVAAVAPAPAQPLPAQSSLTIALPIQNPRTIPGSSGGGGREDCWSEGATSVLIDAWGERYLELSRGNLKQKHWKEVADIVGSSEGYMKAPTDIQCKNRIDTVKKKYKIEKAKIASGNGPSKWPFFETLDRLIGNSAKIPSATPVVSTVAAAVYSNSGQKVPVGIPVGRPVRNYQLQAQQQQQTPSKVQYTPVGLPQIQKPHRIASSSNSSRSQRQQQSRRRPLPPVDSFSEPEDQLSPDSADSLPPETFDRRRKLPKMAFNPAANPRSGSEAARGGGGMQREKEKVGAWGNSVRELTRAMLNLAEAYEQAENLKLQQLVDLEKQRMKFAKDLELQRMKIMVKTQFDISQLSRDSSGGSRRAAGGGGGPESSDGGDGNVNNNHRISNSVGDNNGVNVDHVVIDSSN